LSKNSQILFEKVKSVH